MIVDLQHRFAPDFWRRLDAWGAALDPAAENFIRLNDQSFSPGLPWTYNHSVSTHLLEQLAPTAAQVYGRAVRPCHSVVRVATRGTIIAAHTDNPKKVPPACSLNLTAHTDPAAPWPLIIHRDGRDRPFTTAATQCVLLRAVKERHGRPTAYHGGKHVNLILCYANADDTTDYPYAPSAHNRLNLATDGARILSSFR